MEKLCAAFFEDLNSKDVQVISDWFTDDAIIWIPPAGPVASKRKIAVYFRAVFQKYKQLEWKITEVFCVGEKRCLILSDSKGIFKDDKPYTNHLVTELRFDEQDKLTFLSDYFKDTHCFSTGNK